MHAPIFFHQLAQVQFFADTAFAGHASGQVLPTLEWFKGLPASCLHSLTISFEIPIENNFSLASVFHEP